MDWHTTTLIDGIKRHIMIAAPNLIAVAPTPRAMKRYGAALEQLDPRSVRIVDIGTVPDVACIVVIGDGMEESIAAYACMSAAKHAGIPVLLGSPERRLAEVAPGWEGTGVSYDGMYFLAAQYAKTIRPKGAYCEFGVFDGWTFSKAYHALKDACTKFHAFDSFRGIGGTLEIEKSHFGDGQYFANIETFDYNMRYIGAEADRIGVVRGFFEETICGKFPADLGIGEISIAHIDVDVYAPALLALEFISPSLSEGALLMFDDYDQHAASNRKGERRAVREWLAGHPEFEVEAYREYGTFCRSFIVHRI